MEYALLKWVVWRPQYLFYIKYKKNTCHVMLYYVAEKDMENCDDKLPLKLV